MNKKTKIIYITIGIVCLLLCAFFIFNAFRLQNIEFNEQITQIGYYKEDVHLSYSRFVGIIASCISAGITGFISLLLTLIGITS